MQHADLVRGTCNDYLPMSACIALLTCHLFPSGVTYAKIGSQLRILHTHIPTCQLAVHVLHACSPNFNSANRSLCSTYCLQPVSPRCLMVLKTQEAQTYHDLCLIYRYFQQLIDGVQYCHKEGIVHRDLRMEHLLLDGSIYSPTLKITGFGYSKSEILDSQPCSNVGTPAYVPPEVLMAKNGTKGYDGQAMDVWACGVILFKMLTGAFPFQDGPHANQLTRKMMRDVAAGRVRYPQDARVHPAAQKLIKLMLNPDPKQRATLAQIQEHKWVMAAQASPKKLGTVSSQSPEEISRIVKAARVQPVTATCNSSGQTLFEDEVNWP